MFEKLQGEDVTKKSFWIELFIKISQKNGMGRTLSVCITKEKKVLHKIQNSKRSKTRWSNFELETATEEVYPELAEMEEKGSNEAESKDLYGLDPDVLASLFQMTLQKGDQKFEDAVAFNTLSFALAMVSTY